MKVNKKPILEIEDLYKKYPRKKAPAINKISLKVFPGEFHAFIGANGAGKTTTIKCITGAYARWSGKILIDNIKNTSKLAKTRLGYIPENARFPASMSCLSYLTWMARLSGLNRLDARNYSIKTLKDLNMWNLQKKSPNTFSSGQKKKILLAQALVHNPDILIMDEPAANLDPKARLELYETLSKLQKQNKAIFISSHVLSELDKYTNAVTFLDGGKVIYSGSINDLYKKYASNNTYAIKSYENDEVKKILKNFNINNSYDALKDEFIINFKSINEKKEFINKLNDKNINFYYLKKVGMNLSDIYNNLIKLGSVDTMQDNSK